jgi:hypothetical protein
LIGWQPIEGRPILRELLVGRFVLMPKIERGQR